MMIKVREALPFEYDDLDLFSNLPLDEDICRHRQHGSRTVMDKPKNLNLLSETAQTRI